MNQEVDVEGLGEAGPCITEHLYAAGLRLHQARDLLADAQPGTQTVAEKHVVAALRAVDEALLHISALAVGIVRHGLPNGPAGPA
ncbi:MAG TPA: hypothetical protein VJ870_03015 [Amycolatopsis sp.]|nr:hypothetical protein [Amycolatopsis sp.]